MQECTQPTAAATACAPTARLPARSHNGIEVLEGLGSLVHLKILDVANNRIKRLEGLEALQVGGRCGLQEVAGPGSQADAQLRLPCRTPVQQPSTHLPSLVRIITHTNHPLPPRTRPPAD